MFFCFGKRDEKLSRLVSAAPGRAGFLTLLRKRNFLLLWLAQMLSMTLLNASNYALIIIIQEVTRSTTLVGLAIIVYSLPAVLLGAPAGAFVDRRNKQRVLFFSNCLRALATLGFVISLSVNRTQLWPIYVLTFLVSAIGQFFAPAEGATIPILVDENELPHALSLFQITFMLSTALGFILFAPILISILPELTFFHVSFTSVEFLYTIIALLYLLCAVFIRLIPHTCFANPQLQKTNRVRSSENSRSIWQEVLEGWNFIRCRPVLFLSVVQLSCAGVLFSVISELAPRLVTDLLRLPTNSMALVLAPAGVGLVLSSVFMPHILKAWGSSRTIFIGGLALPVLIALVPLITLLAQSLEGRGVHVEVLHIVAVSVIMFFAGAAINFINVSASTTMQEMSPDRVKGRVLSLQLMLFNACSIPVILLIGALADRFQLSFTIYVLAIGILAFDLWSFYYQRKPHPRASEVLEKTPEKVNV